MGLGLWAVGYHDMGFVASNIRMAQWGVRERGDALMYYISSAIWQIEQFELVKARPWKVSSSRVLRSPANRHIRIVWTR